MLKGLKGKTVLITGASGDIGRAACRRFLEEGCNIVAAQRRESPELVEELGSQGVCVSCDVSTEEGAAEGVRKAVERFGALDLAFINAGVESNAVPVAGFTNEEFDRVYNVNVRGQFLTAKAVVNYLLGNKRPGGILFMSSIAGLQGYANLSIYNSSKHAIIGIAKSLAHEVGVLGIRVNIICPGPVASRMSYDLEDTMAAAAGVDSETMKQAVENLTDLRRYAYPEEVAAMAAWILSDEVPYCHGETFTLGGGQMA